MKNKKGNVEILILLLGIILLILVLAVFYILNVQINSYIYPIKQDIFYIVQNSVLSLNKNDLSYFEYNIDEQELKNKIEFLFEKNHKNVHVDSIKYNYKENKIEIDVIITFKPIVLYGLIGDINLKVHDSIKIKSMEVIEN